MTKYVYDVKFKNGRTMTMKVSADSRAEADSQMESHGDIESFTLLREE